jgi:molecular chaperone IbpA
MTRHLTSVNLDNFLRNAIGLESFFENAMTRVEHANSGNYPPYNIIKITDDQYEIEIAVAGFAKEDIRVVVNEGMLLIDGAKEKEVDVEEPEYLYRGISSRSFSRSFALADHVEVKSATVVDGVLKVELEREVPESLKPKQIEVK